MPPENNKAYSARNVFDGLVRAFHQYLEAQYHVWDESLIAGRRHLLESSGTTFQEPHLEATPFYLGGKKYRELAIPDSAKDILTLAARRPNAGIFPKPYLHQAQALEAFLGRDAEIIVATGTGSGKTESFLMPILGALAVESRLRPLSWDIPGVRALLLYPMNALVNDQLGRLRRLFGDPDVAKALKGRRPGRATFGMYTSRTPYPGKSSPGKDRERIGKVLEQLYQNVSAEVRESLEREGKWPAKDIDRFISSLFVTGDEDSELLSRQEMQRTAPDLLVTNYSMLEYMLLRPIEKTVFEQTAHWLASDSSNRFMVVLDEAHMYRGSGGAEVAYLLRRLHSRLRIPRDRVKYILTSASLGSGDEAARRIENFAAELTGLSSNQPPFLLIKGNTDRKKGERPCTVTEARALARFDFAALHRTYESMKDAGEAFAALCEMLDYKPAERIVDEESLRQAVYTWLGSFGPAALTANLITSRPRTLGAIAAVLCPAMQEASEAFESLLALMSFGREQGTNRVFAPVRSHLFFRGLPGLFACIDPNCRTRLRTDEPTRLGQIYGTPRLRCECSARVYELLTHRDCGAAFIRGYLADENADFLWHERARGLWADLQLLEGHFLVEVDRKSADAEGVLTWLHIPTGQLSAREPSESKRNEYLRVLRPDGVVVERGRPILTFNKECPVCVRGWQGTSKIMDLATKGEAPFAHLVREQVALQPMTQLPTEQAPNGGRKSLLFSDGRQKAARLARDIPREIEQDVFRQLLFMAVDALKRIGREPVLSHWIYVAFLDVLARTGLQLLDGEDRNTLLRHVREYKKWHAGNLVDAIQEFASPPPAGFKALLHRQLGSRFYSVYALTLGYLRPTAKASQVAAEAFTQLPKSELLDLAPVWLQNFADKFAFDPDEKAGIRIRAAGYPVSGGLAAKSGFSKRQHDFLTGRVQDFDALLKALSGALCERDASGALFLAPKRVALALAVNDTWYQCTRCTAISPVRWWGRCPNCLTDGPVPVQPGATSYLRARKGFWRDPIVDALEGRETPLNITVEEHTAQLSYRDVDEPSPTTEEFERRFKDILIGPEDTSIDVLSSTTTMEVGIDIGSLVAVGLRNVPPLRQNYQQRAGRAGRRGSAISTVVTYAQNSPHDSFYFEKPEAIIAGEPTLPSVDTRNPKIIKRHVRAQLIQAFFHQKGAGGGSANIFTMLGDTWTFYNGEGTFSLKSFSDWLASPDVTLTHEAIQAWLPAEFEEKPSDVAAEFLRDLRTVKPSSKDELEQADEHLIEFLFSRSFLPSYAFPRDLCALQIEQRSPAGRAQIVQRPQQGLNIALSEYAPGRFVVVDKKTYRIGTVAASGTSVIEDRAERLFSGKRLYVHCPACLFTAGFLQELKQDTLCPLCRSAHLDAVAVIQPEVVYPENGKEVDEYDDEQIYSQSTGAQLPLPEGEAPFEGAPFLSQGRLAFARNQPLVMVNKGTQGSNGDGFLVCNRCGKTALDGKPMGSHRRDYQVDTRRGGQQLSHRCNGEFESVYLGYSFASDILLFRIPVPKPLRFDAKSKRARQPIADALQSLCDAFVIATSRQLDIDNREINSGYRFVRLGADHYADIFLYDTLSGGAGYATQAGEVFPKIFEQVEKLLADCSCYSSCDRCLRYYGNRMHHELLDRYLALDLARFIRTGEFPKMFDKREQAEELRPLVQMLSLAGWNVQHSQEAPIIASRASRTLELHCYPSLIDPVNVGFIPSTSSYAFSPYELSRDLPGAYAEVTQ